MNNDMNTSAQEHAVADQQPRHPAQPIMIDEDAENWINLMMGINAAHNNPELRAIVEERVLPEVLRAAEECVDYDDFLQRLERYKREGLPHA